MSWANYDDALRQIQSAGLDVTHLEIDTPRPVRCRETNGDREKRGWYWLHSISLESPKGSGQYQPFIVGSFGVYRGTDAGKQKLRLAANGAALSAETAAAIRARHAESVKRAQALRAADHARAAREAANAWAHYLPENPAGTVPDYLKRKAVKAYGLRYSPSGNGTLAIPMCDAGGTVHGLQIIRGKDRGRKREKEYWPRGVLKQAHFHMIGSPGAVILLVEGYATGATVFEATGLCTVVAFDAGNLMHVALALHKAWPGAHIMVCADDDYLTEGNPGWTSARNAALAVQGAVAVPEFPEDRDGQRLTDFNDLANLPSGGLHLVRTQLEAALGAAGVSARLSRLAPIPGGGDERRAEALMDLEALIERFTPIDDGTGEFVFDDWTKKIARKTQMLALLPAGVRGDDIKRHPQWRMRGACFIDQIGFDPGGQDPRVRLNTWKGWPLTPSVEGSCTRVLDLVYWLCTAESNPDEVYRWLLKWLAYPLQHPGAKMKSSVIMHGPQGTGKSTIFQAVGKLYGEYSRVLNQSALEDKFNSDWVDSILYVVAEEVVARNELWHVKNELKEFITGEWVRINPKNLPAYRQRNQINVVYLSNETQPLPLDIDDRRHLVVYTPPAQHEQVYKQVHAELGNGGLERLYHYLLHEVDTSDFSPDARPPMTRSKEALIDVSRPSEAKFIEDWMLGQLEIHDGIGPIPFCPCTGRQLYGLYKKWAAAGGYYRPRDEIQFIGYLRRLPGWRAGVPVQTYENFNTQQRRPRRMVIPSDEALACAREAGTWTVEQDPDQSQTAWLTTAFFKFDSALKARHD